MAIDRLTVLQLVPALDGGGVERGTLEVAQALVEKGHRSLVVSAGGRLVKELESQGSEHYCWPFNQKTFWTLRCIWPLRRFIRQQQIDIIHFRSRIPGWIVYLAWRGMPADQRPRLVSTVHGLHSVNAYSAVMTKGERVIAVSNTVQRYILDNYPKTLAARIRVIYRGVDPALFPRNFVPGSDWLQTWNAAYPQLAGRFVVVLPGRLTRLKGHNDFFAIIAALKARGLAVSGLIVGGEDFTRQSYAKEIYQAVEALGLHDEIIFTGHRSDMREIYSQSQLVLSLSTKPESFGRTVLEALSMGLPVIGYDHGGVGEVLANLYPYGRVALGDTAAVIGKIEQAVSDGAPPVAENNLYLKDGMLEQTLGVYDELAGSGSDCVE